MTGESDETVQRDFAALQSALLPEILHYLDLEPEARDERKRSLVRLLNHMRSFRAVLERQSLLMGSPLSALCLELADQLSINSALRLLLSSFLFDVCKNADLWVDTLDYAGDPTFAFASTSLLLNVEYLGFMNKAGFSDDDYQKLVRAPLQLWYKKLFNQAPKNIQPPQELSPGHGRVAIILRLWREPPMYAPALEALDYAHCLVKEFNVEVELFNANLLHDNMPVPVWPPAQFGPLPLTEQTSLTYKGETFRLTHRLGSIGDPVGAKNFWTQIQNFAPEFAIALGDCNLYADLLASRIPVVTAHYTSDLPITTAAIPGVHVGFSSFDGTDPTTANTTNASFALRAAGTDEPIRKTYRRAEFGIPEDVFVFAIIGNRLRSELSQDYLISLRKIMESCRRVWFVFVGFYDQAEEQLAFAPELRSRAVLIPHIDDIGGFMFSVDGLLNPDRAGGGSVAKSALASGKPVVALGRGDVAHIIGQENTCADVDEYVRKAVRLVEDYDFYASVSLVSAKRYGQLIDRRFNIRAMREAARKANETGKTKSP